MQVTLSHKMYKSMYNNQPVSITKHKKDLSTFILDKYLWVGPFENLSYAHIIIHTQIELHFKVKTHLPHKTSSCTIIELTHLFKL